MTDAMKSGNEKARTILGDTSLADAKGKAPANDAQPFSAPTPANQPEGVVIPPKRGRKPGAPAAPATKEDIEKQKRIQELVRRLATAVSREAVSAPYSFIGKALDNEDVWELSEGEKQFLADAHELYFALKNMEITNPQHVGWLILMTHAGAIGVRLLQQFGIPFMAGEKKEEEKK